MSFLFSHFSRSEFFLTMPPDACANIQSDRETQWGRGKNTTAGRKKLQILFSHASRNAEQQATDRTSKRVREREIGIKRGRGLESENTVHLAMKPPSPSDGAVVSCSSVRIETETDTEMEMDMEKEKERRTRVGGFRIVFVLLAQGIKERNSSVHSIWWGVNPN